MQFGIFFDLQLPRPWDDEDECQLFKEALEQVELADRLGLEFAWVMEHHFLEEYSHSSAPEAFLAACSQRTKNIRLGHGIVLMPPAYNHPARVAERIATLDLLSGGRVEWGIGTSGSRIEMEGFNINPDEKQEMLLEAVREATKMLCSNPYPGFKGRYFSMPPRNIVPKPLQKPHPPLWIACTDRNTIRRAAKCGMGALTFAFDLEEAHYLVEDYYSTFKQGCEPIGRTVNPNIAMITGIMCHADSEVAVARGLEGFQFFRHALSHYYVTGTHIPGAFNLWEDFKQNASRQGFSVKGIGNPEQVKANLEKFEEMGVDQMLFIHQAGKTRHEHICESLELFATHVLPAFQERHQIRERRKMGVLAPDIERAMNRIPPLPQLERVPPLDSYPVAIQKAGLGFRKFPNKIKMRDSLTVTTFSPTEMELRSSESEVILIRGNVVSELIPALIRELDGSQPSSEVISKLEHIASPEVIQACIERLFEQGVLVEVNC
jgi:alkanesulfonate monooxygenase SsuD/methylene tetrahydromethanopterin reductase-like flavin-dependent oxidoreductase (luciferase family)